MATKRKNTRFRQKIEKKWQNILPTYELFHGFVILHQTDTLAYTASVLSFMLENLGKNSKKQWQNCKWFDFSQENQLLSPDLRYLRSKLGAMAVTILLEPWFWREITTYRKSVFTSGISWFAAIVLSKSAPTIWMLFKGLLYRTIQMAITF